MTALGSVYLLHQLEFFFRILSGVISWDGLFISDEARFRTAEKLDPNMASRLKKWKLSSRVNSPDVAYAAMVAMSDEPCVKVFRQLDDELPKVTVANNETISNIGERITYFRHPVSHGALGDPSSEGIFYALMMTIILYGSRLFARRAAPAPGAPALVLDPWAPWHHEV
jgi:hypothetical protein